MSLLQRQVSTITLQERRLGDGLSMVKSTTKLQKEDIGDTKSEKQELESVSSMQESPQLNKQKTSKDKSSTSKESIQVSKLSEILEAELTSKGKALSIFWNNYSKEISEKLWCPQLTGSQELEQSNCLDGSLNTSVQNLPYLIKKEINPQTKNLQTTCLKLSQFSPRVITAKENIRTRKVRFYPDDIQKAFLDKCFNAHRYFYNKALEFSNQQDAIFKKEGESIYPSFQNIRNAVVIADSDLTEDNLWMKEVPYDVRQNAVKVLTSALASSKALLKNMVQTHSTLRFLSKKNKSHVCYFPKTGLLKGFRIAPKRLGKHSKLIFRTRMKRWLTKITNDGDFSIIKNQANQYYICLVIKSGEVEFDQTDQSEKEDIVSLDPGSRTFQTYYSTNECGLIGTDTMLKRLHNRLDKLQSEQTKAEYCAKTKYHMRRRCSLLRIKIANRVRDLHWQTASWLTKKYKVILIPIFETKDIVEKSNNRHMNRNLISLSHYSFRERLKHCARQNGSIVITCSEAYTSQTCGGCGKLDPKLGSKKEYNCSTCKLKMHRDINGARNILIRSLTKYRLSVIR